MIQYVILECVLSTVIQMVIEKYVRDPATRRYVRQMTERVVREVLREAQRRGLGLMDLFSSQGFLNEVADRVYGVFKSVGISSEDVRETFLNEATSHLKSPMTYLSSVTETMSKIFFRSEDEDLPDHGFSEKVLDYLIESAEKFVYLASPWVSNPKSVIEEGVRSLKELPDRKLELYLLVASNQNDRNKLLGWASLGFEVREVEGHGGNDLGIHCKVYANEKVAIGASWNLTVRSLRRLRGMREVHTICPNSNDCDVCSANYRMLLQEFEERLEEAKQRFFRDEGKNGPAIFEVRWKDDRPTKVTIRRKNGKHWLTVELNEHHEGFTFNGRIYQYKEEYLGFTPMDPEDELVTEVVHPFVGLVLERVRPEHLKVVERDVEWTDDAERWMCRLLERVPDGALIAWGLDPDPRVEFYVPGGKLLAVRCRESDGTLRVRFVDVVSPRSLPKWVSGRLDIGLLLDRSSGEATPTFFVHE